MRVFTSAVAFVLLALPLLATAGSVEHSMVVTGTISVNPDGSVAAYTLDQTDKIPEQIQKLTARSIPGLRFEPIREHGKPARASTAMSIRIVANKVDTDKVRLRIAGLDFGCRGDSVQTHPDVCPKSASFSPLSKEPPRYPRTALRARAQGRVLLVLQVDRQGRVRKAAARQVNLTSRVSGSEGPSLARKAFADVSVAAAKDWRFQVPTEGLGADRDYWFVQVPMVFKMTHSRREPASLGYAEWTTYIPGPVQPVAWLQTVGGGAGASALAGDSPFLADSRFVLKTKLATPDQGGSSS